MTSLMILFSDSACCLLLFSQRVFKTVASWQTAFSKLSSCHFAASFLFTVSSTGPEKKRELKEIAMKSRIVLQALHRLYVRGVKKQYNTFCKVTLAYILLKTSCHQKLTSISKEEKVDI